MSEQIIGHRPLTEREIELMNRVKEASAHAGELIAELQRELVAGEERVKCAVAAGSLYSLVLSADEYEANRWLEIAKDHLQMGWMAAGRAISRQLTF